MLGACVGPTRWKPSGDPGGSVCVFPLLFPLLLLLLFVLLLLRFPRQDLRCDGDVVVLDSDGAGRL